MVGAIIFDFDGVIVDSVPVKTEAFRRIFSSFPQENVEELLEYHRNNGGISRYKKIRYFFENIRGELIDECEVQQYAKRFSLATLAELCMPKYIIGETLDFIQKYAKTTRMYIASGADQNDLVTICNVLKINSYFVSILGSPAEKAEIVKRILLDNKHKADEIVMVGDSINDYEAANANQVRFAGFNNENLKKEACRLGFVYLDRISQLSRL